MSLIGFRKHSKYYLEREQRRAKWRVFPGIALLFVGILLCAVSGAHLDANRFATVPGAQIGLILMIAGFGIAIWGIAIEHIADRSYRG